MKRLLIIIIAVLLFASPSFGQCTGGVCRPVKQLVVKKRTTEVHRTRVLRPVLRKVIFWR